MNLPRNFLLRFRDGLPAILVILILSGLASLMFSLPRLPQFIDGTLLQDLKFNFPIFLDMDKSDNIFVIDSNSRRVICLDPQGKVRWVADGGQRDRGFYETTRLAASGDGGACVYNQVYNPISGDIESEDILLYDSSGHLRGPLVHSTVPDETILSFSVRDNKLRYFRKLDGKLALHETPLDTRNSTSPEQHQVLFSAPCSVDFVVALQYDPNTLILSDRLGRLVTLDRSGQVGSLDFAASADGTFTGFKKPWDIKEGPDSAVYVLDLLLRGMYRLPGMGSSEPVMVFGDADVFAAGMDNPAFEFMAVSPRGTLGLVDKSNHSIWLKAPDGTVRILSGGQRPGDHQLFSIAALAVFGIFILSALWASILILRRIFAENISLMVKQVSVLLPLVIISVLIGTSRMLVLIQDQYDSQVNTKLSLMAGLGSSLIDGSILDKLNTPADWHGQAHKKLLEMTDALVSSNKDPWNKDFGVVVYKVVDGRFYMVRSSSSYYGLMYPFGKPTREHIAASRSGEITHTTYLDEYGGWICGLAPLRNSQGTITGVLEVYHNSFFRSELEADFNAKLLTGIIIIILVVITLLVLLDVVLFLALNSLRRASEKVTVGHWGITVPALRRDEIGDLSRDFNTMSMRLKDYFNRLEEIRDANARFVPKEFISYLDRSSLADVRSGEQKKHRMTMFFSDIRSFTALSEGMTPKENFDFINAYLSVMGPIIRKHGGFIDRYLGDAIMALFPGSPSQAVVAALEMREELVRFNRVREAEYKTPIDFGVGIHTDDLILGIVGEERRLAATVVSEAVDLVNRLEALNKQHHTNIVLTQVSWQDLSPDLRLLCKALGTVDYESETMPIFGIALHDGDE